MKTKRILCRMKPRDIKNGVPGDPCHCPIAECIKRTLKIEDYVSVRLDQVKVGIHFAKRFKTSIRMQRFINKIDKKIKTKPINFYLEEISR